MIRALIAVVALSMLGDSGAAAESPSVVDHPADTSLTGDLIVSLNEIRDSRGQAVATLYQSGDAVSGEASTVLVAPIQERRAVFTFSELEYGAYALVVFHDERVGTNSQPELNGRQSIEQQY